MRRAEKAETKVKDEFHKGRFESSDKKTSMTAVILQSQKHEKNQELKQKSYS
jgi:hypothetical protein